MAVSLVKPGSKGSEAPAPEVALGPMPVAPAPEAAAAAAPAPAPEQGGGRRLLQLLRLEKKQQASAPQLEKPSGTLSTGSSTGEQLGLDEAKLAAQPQPQQLPTRDTSLATKGSAAVLLASGVDVYASSSQQGVHSRGHSQQHEAPHDVEQPAAPQR